MSLADPLLSTCGCCGVTGPIGACGCPPGAGDSPRPGLPAVPYRAGTHGSFLAAMKAALDHQVGLSSFTTRDVADPVIGLLDAWATVLDVVTFYQERIANEAYLRTATELTSVYQLAAEIGYVPSAGVATTTYLAFEVESGKGAPASVPIEAGVKVQSLPGPGERPQTFETVESITARPRWNSFRPRQLDPARMPMWGDRVVYLAGTSTGLKAGDPLLVVWSAGNPYADLRTVTEVTPDTELLLTAVTLDAPVQFDNVAQPTPSPGDGVYALRQSAHLFAYNTPRWLSMSATFRDEYTVALGPSYPDIDPVDWPYFSISGIRTAASTVELDASYPKVLPGSLVVLKVPDPFARIFQVRAVNRVAAAAFTVAGDVTQLTLDLDPATDFDNRVRDTEALIHSEQLAVAWPDQAPVTGSQVEFETTVPGLATGQELAFTGPVEKVEVGTDLADIWIVWPQVELTPGELLETTDDPWLWPDFLNWWLLKAPDGRPIQVLTSPDPARKTILRHVPPQGAEQVSEVAAIDQVDDSDPLRTRVTLKTSLQHRYVRRRLSICANVALATHGESKADVLGSGDSSQPFQRFALRQSPLTFVPATGTGADSTLEVRVNGVRWQPMATLYGRGPRDRVYLTQIADDGKVTIQFGDGVTGARLPTGIENVSASYRVGIGHEARVRAGQLSLLQTRPLGVKNVTNPVAATGGADPEPLSQARRNAPLTVLTFDRIVSLTDFENFAAAFAGIAKARAAWLWDGVRRIVQVTVAGDGGQAVDAGTTLPHLISSIAAAGDGRQPFLVQSFEPVFFDVAVRLYRDPDYLWSAVQAAAVAALSTAFAFDAREFASPVAESQVMAALQAVPGVLGVRLVGLNLTGDTPQPNPILVAKGARLEQDGVHAAQLLVINSAGIDLQEQT